MASEKTHRRLNLLTNEWILVCSKRTKRPWQGAKEEIQAEQQPQHDSSCYLCPGNTRANKAVNPDYKDTFVFENDFAALQPSGNLVQSTDGLLKTEEVSGECRVICYSPQHDLTLAQMSVQQIETVVELWQQQFNELSKKYDWVQLFENKGAIMGCSNPHPHGQIWASDFLPNEVNKEQQTQQAYFAEHGHKLLLDYAAQEIVAQQRIVSENDSWLVVVPHWATWPYETLLLPKDDIASWRQLNTAKKKSLAQILKSLLTKYDQLFNVSFPYSMGWHCAPGIEGSEKFWQLHAHFYPPLLRSATVKKFMVGYEMLAESQRDFTPEQAAATLREL